MQLFYFSLDKLFNYDVTNDNYDSNDAINENSGNDSSNENYVIRRSFQFTHDGSLSNE